MSAPAWLASRRRARSSETSSSPLAGHDDLERVREQELAQPLGDVEGQLLLRQPPAISGPQAVAAVAGVDHDLADREREDRGVDRGGRRRGGRRFVGRSSGGLRQPGGRDRRAALGAGAGGEPASSALPAPPLGRLAAAVRSSRGEERPSDGIRRAEPNSPSDSRTATRTRNAIRGRRLGRCGRRPSIRSTFSCTRSRRSWRLSRSTSLAIRARLPFGGGRGQRTASTADITF